MLLLRQEWYRLPRLRVVPLCMMDWWRVIRQRLLLLLVLRCCAGYGAFDTGTWFVQQYDFNAVRRRWRWRTARYVPSKRSQRASDAENRERHRRERRGVEACDLVQHRAVVAWWCGRARISWENWWTNKEIDYCNRVMQSGVNFLWFQWIKWPWVYSGGLIISIVIWEQTFWVHIVIARVVNDPSDTHVNSNVTEFLKNARTSVLLVSLNQWTCGVPVI